MRVQGAAFVGCSGWNYRDWRGTFYPEAMPPRDWLAHYATRFGSVEVNSTFYGLPSEAVVDAWRRAVPAGFTFAVKLGGFGTHRKKLRDAESWLPHHVDRLQHLGPAFGPTLVQLPPHWHRDVERLDAFLSVAPRHLRWAVELRDPSWVHDDVFATLERHGVALCIDDRLATLPRIVTTDWTYMRFHGPPARTGTLGGRYTGRRLRRPLAWMCEQLDAGRDVYAYFNNDADAAAVADAAWLAAHLEGVAPART